MLIRSSRYHVLNLLGIEPEEGKKFEVSDQMSYTVPTVTTVLTKVLTRPRTRQRVNCCS